MKTAMVILLVLFGAGVMLAQDNRPATNQELADHVFIVKDAAGAPVLQITNVKTSWSFGMTVKNISDTRLVLKIGDLIATYTVETNAVLNPLDVGKTFTVPVNPSRCLVQRWGGCDLTPNHEYEFVGRGISRELLSLDFSLAPSWFDNRPRDRAWEKQVAIDTKKAEVEDAAKEKRQAAASAVAAKERAKAKAACAMIHTNTIDRKTSDLTVRETEQVNACRVLGFYR